MHQILEVTKYDFFKDKMLFILHRLVRSIIFSELLILTEQKAGIFSEWIMLVE